MTAAAKNSFGTEFWMCPAGGTLVKISEAVDITPMVAKRGMIDVTSHDSAGGVQELIPEGVYDPGQAKVKMLYVANSTADIALALAMTGGAKQDFKIVEKSAASPWKKSGSGYISEYGPDNYDIKGKQMASFTLDVTGPITGAVGP